MLFRARVHPVQAHRDGGKSVLSAPSFLAMLAMALLASTCGAPASAASDVRFAVAATLQRLPTTNGSGRFVMNAALHPQPATRSAGQFVVHARLNPKVGATAISTACAPLSVELFKNDFETP